MNREKIDTLKKADKVEEEINAQKAKERKLFPLRISRTTIILVPRKKCNDEYAEWYREHRMKC